MHIFCCILVNIVLKYNKGVKMRAEEIRTNFSNNIKSLREKKRLTQSQLGASLGYSDKSISKWENGDVMPDVVVLDHIASFFNVTVNDLIDSQIVIKQTRTNKHALITASTFFGVLSIASVIFFALQTFTDNERLWLIYVYTLPVFCIIFIALTSVFFNYKLIIVAISLLIWTVALSLYLTFNEITYFWTIFTISASIQIVLLFMFFIIRNYKKLKKENKKI